MNWAFYATIYATVAVPLGDAVTALTGNVLDYVHMPLLAGITLGIGLCAIAASYGFMSFQSVYKLLFAGAVIEVLLLTVTTYDQYVVQLVDAIPFEVGRALAGGGDINNISDGGAFDHLWNTAAKAGLLAWEHIPSYSLKGALLTLFVGAYFVGVFLVILGGFLVCLASTTMVKLLLTIGGLFLALYPFPPLRKFCHGWVSALASAVLVEILAVAVLALMGAGEMATINRIVQQATAGKMEFTDELFLLLQASGVFYLVYRLLKQIPSVAVAIAGGVYQAVAAHAATAPMNMALAGAQMAVGAAARGAAGMAGQAVKSYGPRVSAAVGRSLSAAAP